MAIFTSKCPCCNAELQLDDDWIGKKGLCPICQEHFIINKNNGYTPPKITLLSILHSLKFDRRYFLVKVGETLRWWLRCFLVKVGKTLRRWRRRYVNDSYDLKEDEFVLQYLKTAKTWNFVYHLLLAIALVVVGIILCCDNKEEAGIFCFLSLLPLINAYFLIKVLLSWFRGVYRNLLQ